MMSVETPWPTGGLAGELEDDGRLAERVLPLPHRADAEVAQLGVADGGGVDGAEDRVDRAVAEEVAVMLDAVAVASCATFA